MAIKNYVVKEVGTGAYFAGISSKSEALFVFPMPYEPVAALIIASDMVDNVINLLLIKHHISAEKIEV